MPPLHHLNPPPHPFWDFVQNLDDHPFFAAYAPRAPDANTQQPGASQPQQDSGENARGKQPAAADPPEVDPSTMMPGNFQENESREMPFRGRDHHHGRSREGCEGRRGPGCRGRGGWRGRGGGFGGPPPGFGFGHPFWAGQRHPHPHHHHQRGPSHERHRRGPSPGQSKQFDLGDFLNNLGDRLGIDLAGAAENLGLDKFAAPGSGEETDFQPRTDIFDTAVNYIIHASLPGAKKEDIAVDWDGEHSILRLTGVVHRPEVDEELLKQLTVDGRKRENGVFEKAIRLGTKRDPASVDVAGISAKMIDGVLIVKVPKVDKEVQKREVPITESVDPQAAKNEKDLLFDADEEMYDAVPTPTAAASKEKGIAAATENKSPERDDRSVTVENEPLPRYEVEEAASTEHSLHESDWERDSEEGDYVKINVD